MKSGEQRTVELQGRTVDYRLIRSKAARHLRLRVGLNGVEVVHPSSRHTDDTAHFIQANGKWICEQLDRIERLRGVRQPKRWRDGEILFRGRPTPIRMETNANSSANKIVFKNNGIDIRQGALSRTPLVRSLENWLRKQARAEIDRLLPAVSGRLRRSPKKVYVMGQRTKWGNCSAKKNLSFNWRLVLAPEFVLRYFVTHEVAHLAVPNHSSKFWLTLQSNNSEAQKARQWLNANGHRLMVDLLEVIQQTSTTGGLPMDGI
jgi:predicted metal-dependent hydrolase